MALARAGTTTPVLPPDLRLGILSLLPPNDLTLCGRLSCRDAAQRFGQPHHRIARLSQPLPGHVVTATDETTATWCVEAAQAALRELTFRRKLLLPSTAAASGCEANVEFALQLLQPHVFPELLRTDWYLALLNRGMELQVPDVGCAAVASGLAHMLPSLAQRCPGLLDPGATLEAAARHLSLAELQAAWEAVGPRLASGLGRLRDTSQGGGMDQEQQHRQPRPQQQRRQQQQQEAQKVHGVWQRVLSAAVGSPCPDAEAKMAWVLDRGRTHVPQAVVDAEMMWGAAAASGDLARLQRLRGRGFPWDGAEALVGGHADLGFILQMERAAGWLPHAGDEWWSSEAAVCAVAGSARGSVPKLRWLAGRGAALESVRAVQAAVARGDLEAAQLMAGHWRGEAEQQGPLPASVMRSAVESGSVPTASWLLQQQFGVLDQGCFQAAFRRGDLVMVRWLLQARCPRGTWGINHAVAVWPGNTAAHAEAAVAAVQLLAAEGWPRDSGGGMGALLAAAMRHPWAVLQAVLGLSGEPAAGQLPQSTLSIVVASGCEATLEAMEQVRALDLLPAALACNWLLVLCGRRCL